MLSTKMQVFCQKRKWLVFRSQFGPLFLIRHATNNFLFTHTHNHAHNVSRMALMRFWLAKCELKLFRGSGVRGSCSCVDALGNQRQQQVCVYGPFNCSENSNGARLKGITSERGRKGLNGAVNERQRPSEKWPTNDKVQRQSTSLVFIPCRSVKRTRQTTEEIKKDIQSKGPKRHLCGNLWIAAWGLQKGGIHTISRQEALWKIISFLVNIWQLIYSFFAPTSFSFLQLELDLVELNIYQEDHKNQLDNAKVLYLYDVGISHNYFPWFIETKSTMCRYRTNHLFNEGKFC